MAEYFYFKNLSIEGKHLLFKDVQGQDGTVESCVADKHISYRKVIFKSDIKKNSQLINEFKKKIADAINAINIYEDTVEKKINNSNAKIDHLLKLHCLSTNEKIIIDKDLLQFLYGDPIVCENHVFVLKPKVISHRHTKDKFFNEGSNNNLQLSTSKRKFPDEEANKENRQNCSALNPVKLLPKLVDIFYDEEPFELSEEVKLKTPWVKRRKKQAKEINEKEKLVISPVKEKEINQLIFWDTNFLNPKSEISDVSVPELESSNFEGLLDESVAKIDLSGFWQTPFSEQKNDTSDAPKLNVLSPEGVHYQNFSLDIVKAEAEELFPLGEFPEYLQP